MYFSGFVLGIVEGITEFLPISSTAHLMLAAQLMQLAQSEAIKSFEVVIQSGAILAVLVFSLRRFFTTWQQSKRLVWLTAIGFVPTAVIGLLLYSVIKKYLLGNFTIALFALGIGGLVLILFERWYKKSGQEKVVTSEQLSTKQALLVGLCQSIAFIPGVSRSAATVVGGMYLGISRSLIVEFSFLLAVPTMFAATGLDVLKNHAALFALPIGFIAVGFITSFIVAYVVLGWFMRYIKTNTFAPFGWYRITVALLALVLWRF
jgi:undecaprenyl-diphosphatase